MIYVTVNYTKTAIHLVERLIVGFANWLWNEATVQQILILIFGYILIEMSFQNLQRKLPIIKRNFKRELREIKNSFKKSQIRPVKYEYDLEKVKKHNI